MIDGVEGLGEVQKNTDHMGIFIYGMRHFINKIQ